MQLSIYHLEDPEFHILAQVRDEHEVNYRRAWEQCQPPDVSYL